MITSFHGEHRFLSNFWLHEISFEGQMFPSNEHAYVAAKTTDAAIRTLVAATLTPGAVKRIGKTIELRSDWNDVRLNVMRNICTSKFQDSQLFGMLKATEPHELVEGNRWGDVFWGQCPLGTGSNHLGKILMEIRSDFTR